MSKYFVKFINGNQCKNSAESTAYNYVKTLDGILFPDEESKYDFTKEVNRRIEEINIESRRCRDVKFSMWNYDTSTQISIADGICYLEIYKVNLEICSTND
jgi:hypothetical protein